MATFIDPYMAAFLAELSAEYSKLIDKHWAVEGSTLQHHAPFGLEFSSVDGVVARFMEEGIELYPESK